MTDEEKESIDEKQESRVQVENLPVEERELTSEEAEAVKGGEGKGGTVVTYHVENAWPRK